MEYHDLKETIKDNCDAKRTFSLQAKGFEGLRSIAIKSKQLRVAKLVLQHKSREWSMRDAFRSLRLYCTHKAAKRNRRLSAFTYSANSLMFKSLRILGAYAKVRRMRANREIQIREADTMLRVRRAFSMWGCFAASQRYLSGLDMLRLRKLRTSFRSVGVAHLLRISRRAFSAWKQRYEQRQRRGRSAFKRHLFGLAKKVWHAWSAAAKSGRTFRKRLGLFLQHRARRLLQTSVRGIRQLAGEGILKRNCKKVAAVFFLDRRLRKIFAGLRCNARLGQKMQLVAQKRAKITRTKCYGIWWAAFTQSYSLKCFLVQRVQRRIKRCVKEWAKKMRQARGMGKVLAGYKRRVERLHIEKWRQNAKKALQAHN